MTRIIYFVLTLVLVLCSRSARAAASPWAVFDDFSGPPGAANPAYWSDVTGTGWDEGVEEYTSANAYINGQGQLDIRAVATGNGYTSGRVETKNKLSMGYGTIAARIKMPSGHGLWPGFWLVGADEGTTGSPQWCEIDIIELVSNATTYYSTLHGPISGNPNTPDGTLQAQFTGPITDLSTDFHNYWVTRKPDSITVGIDDKAVGTFTPESLPPGAQWVYNRPMYAIFNLAVGGSWAGPPDSSTKFPAFMFVKWVPI